MGNVILGLLVIVLGGVVVYFSSNLTSVVGRNAWAERNLGGTRNAIVLFGFVVIVIGVIMMFGMLDNIGNTMDTGMGGLG